MTFCQIKTNYKHVVLISNGLSRYCSTLQKILKLSSRISSNPARDWEHVTMLKRFYWYFHFQKPICQVLAGWFADGFVSVTRRVVAGGDRDVCVSQAVPQGALLLGRGKCSVFLGSKQGCSTELVGRGSPLPARLVPAGAIPCGTVGAWQIWLEKYGACGEGYNSKSDLWRTILTWSLGFLMHILSSCCQYLRSQLVN